MKCTLRKVSQGVVATVDERPKEGDWILDYGVCSIYIDGDVMIDNGEFKTIIASTFGAGKELYLNADNNRNLDKLSSHLTIGNIKMRSSINYSDNLFAKQYDYTETETQIIINL